MTQDLFDKYIWLVDTIYRAEHNLRGDKRAVAALAAKRRRRPASAHVS